MKKRLLAVAIIATFLIGTFAYAKESEPVQEPMLVIDAEDIGITPIQDIEEKEESEDVLEESEKDYEDVEEAVPEEEEETEEPVIEAPEGIKEGYESNTFYESDKHTECEFSHCVSFNEDTGTYTLEEWCTICGEGAGRTITEEELEVLGVETDVEF